MADDFGLAPQPVSGGDNDLTRYQRSITNLLGQSGAKTQALGLQAVQQPLDYWSKILSGDRASIAEAVAPELRASSQQFEAQRRVLDQYTPMGGGRASKIADLGTAKAASASDIISKARPEAASKIAQVGLSEQQLGIEQLGQAIQAILSKMGLNIQGGTSNTFSSILGAIGSIV